MALVGAGVFQEGYIPLYPETEFWHSLEGRTLDDILDSLKTRPDTDLAEIVTRLLRSDNMGRVFAIFNIQHIQLVARVKQHVCKYGGSTSIAAVDGAGIEFDVLDMMLAIRNDNVQVVRYLKDLPNTELYKSRRMLQDAVESNSAAVVKLFLQDPRTNELSLDYALESVSPRTEPRIVQALITDRRVFAKPLVESHIRENHVETVRTLLEYATVAKPVINMWFRTLNMSPEMRVVLEEYNMRK